MLRTADNEMLTRSGPARRWATCCAATGCRRCSRRSAGAGLPADARAPARRGPRRLPRHRRPRRPRSRRPARTAARRCSSAATRRPACAASTTAGSSTRPAPASTCRPSPPRATSRTRCASRAYPTHESGGIVWTYMGPPETMPAFRDFGTDASAARRSGARASVRRLQLGAGMEGNIDTAHISWLHQYHAASDIPDDGTDKPGYPSNAMSFRFWAHDRAPRLEVRTRGTATATPASARRPTATPTCA